MVMTLCSDVVIPPHSGTEVTHSGDRGSSIYPITRERRVVECPPVSVITTVFLSIPEERGGGREVLHLSCFFPSSYVRAILPGSEELS